MTREEEAKSIALFDSRIVERNIRKGLTNRKDYDKFLKALPDAAAKICPPDERVEDTSGPHDDDDREGQVALAAADDIDDDET